MKRAFRVSFLQLTLLFLIALVFVQKSIISEYMFHLEIFSLVVAFIGVSIFSDQNSCKFSIEPRYVYAILFSIFAISFGLRYIPYLNNNIPLGFDSGIYKHIFDTYMHSLPSIPETNLSLWIKSIHDPGLFSFINIFFTFGVSIDEVLRLIFVLFSSFLIFPIFLLTRKYSNDITALLASFFFVFSYSQYTSFALMYYKNIVGILVFLTAIYLFDKKYNLFVLSLLSVALAFLHRPTFLLYLLIVLTSTAINYKNKNFFVKNLKLIIFSIASLMVLYYHRLNEAIINVFLSKIYPEAVTAGSGGAFFNIFQYQTYSLIYLPFSILGIFYFVYNKKFKNPLFIWLVINILIVLFQIIFFNRYIIHLDIIMIIMAGFGLYSVLNMKSHRKFSVFIVILSVLVSGYIGFDMIKDTKSMIIQEDLDAIIWISNNTEDDAYVMATYNKYGPWVLGYSDRKTIAPGLFEYDAWTAEQWIYWWEEVDIQEFKTMLDGYSRPLYIHVGKNNRFANNTHFEDPCFKEVFNDNRTCIYNYLC